MFSQTLEYALRAMTQVANEAPGPSTTQGLAKSADVPGAYLAKVVQTLRHGGLVTTRRGVGGGVRLSRPARRISLLDVINAVEPIGRNGGGKRTAASLVSLDRKLNALTAQMQKSLAGTSLADVASRNGKRGR
jgi:Rrf2 family protein